MCWQLPQFLSPLVTLSGIVVAGLFGHFLLFLCLKPFVERVHQVGVGRNFSGFFQFFQSEPRNPAPLFLG